MPFFGDWEVQHSSACEACKGRGARGSIQRGRLDGHAARGWLAAREWQGDLPRLATLLLDVPHAAVTSEELKDLLLARLAGGAWHVHPRREVRTLAAAGEASVASGTAAAEQTAAASSPATSPAAQRVTPSSQAPAAAPSQAAPENEPIDARTDQDAFAQALVAASQDGVPFCEICQQGTLAEAA